VTVIVLFLLDGYTNFQIKSQFIKSFVYLGLPIGTPVILIWNAIVFKTHHRKTFGLLLPILTLILILIVGPFKILFSSGAWRTQTILYQNGHSGFKKVEFQMQDIGARGYNKRTIQVLFLTKFFMIVSPVPQDIDMHIEWMKVDKDVNELDVIVST